MDIKNYKKELLDQLYEPYKNCKECPLGSLGRKNVVFGEGNPNATIMLVGEGPGQQEDKQNRPFVGRSGQLLNKALELAGIKREDIFITNVVKCRPPNNRKPLANESNTCKKLLLLKQIKIIRPNVICTLGSAATQAFFAKDIKITQIRGKILKQNALTIIPTYHPAYILRNNKELENFINDIMLTKKYA